MKATFIAPAFIGSAFAAVVPCAPNSEGTAPAPLVNTLAGFYEWNGYSLLALSARTPAGYERALGNGNCAVSSSKYMLYSKLETYDVKTCADICDVHRGCDAFNIYVQRDPSVVPGPGCPNPKAVFTTICALYSEPVSISQCTNDGQYIGPEDAEGEAFRTAFRASNIYARLPAKDTTKMLNTISNPPSILEDINGAIKKLVSVKLNTSTISKAASPQSTPAAAIPVTSSANTTVSLTAIVQPAPTTVLPSVITQAPVELVVAPTTEVANAPSVPTTVSAAVLLGTPAAKQATNASTSEAANTSAPATSVSAVDTAVTTAKAILQAKPTTLLTAVIPQASSVSQTAAPAATDIPSAKEILQSKIAHMLTDLKARAPPVSQAITPAFTATSTASAGETPLPVQKRFNLYGHRHGIFNKP